MHNRYSQTFDYICVVPHCCLLVMVRSRQSHMKGLVIFSRITLVNVLHCASNPMAAQESLLRLKPCVGIHHQETIRKKAIEITFTVCNYLKVQR